MKLWTSWRWASSNLSSSRCILVAFESATWYLSVTSAFSLVRSTSLPLSSVNCEKRALFSTLNRSIRSALNKKEKKRKEKKRKEKKRKRVRPPTWKQKEQREKRGGRRRRGGLTFLGSCHFEATCFASLQRVSLLHAADSRLLSLFQRGAGKKCQTNENKRAKLEKIKGKMLKGFSQQRGKVQRCFLRLVCCCCDQLEVSSFVRFDASKIHFPVRISDYSHTRSMLGNGRTNK